MKPRKGFGLARWWWAVLDRVDPTRRRIRELTGRVEALEDQARRHAVLLGKTYSAAASPRRAARHRRGDVVELLEALLSMSEAARRSIGDGPPGQREDGE